jgi:hypothetical protein
MPSSCGTSRCVLAEKLRFRPCSASLGGSILQIPETKCLQYYSILSYRSEHMSKEKVLQLGILLAHQAM